jgi:S-adenosylmethionine/arginine decarboxylase-like enzyme
MNDTNAYIWGYHASIDMAGCNQKAITDRQTVLNFCKELVEAIDMKAYGEPQLEHFAEHDAGKAGFTLSQLIETSNICAHFVDATGEVYLDIFSCKPFDPEVAADVAGRYFSPQYGEIFFRERGVSLLDTVDTDVAH